jgi:hypothetical protein
MGDFTKKNAGKHENRTTEPYDLGLISENLGEIPTCPW